MEKIKIDLLEGLLNPQIWNYDQGGWKHYTCHDHAFSASECDDTCGTCSGARCCDAEGEFPRVYTDPEKLYLNDELVYGDTIIRTLKLDCKIGNLVNAVRNGDGFFEDDKYDIRIPHEVTVDYLDHLSEKAREFYSKLFELYRMIQK